LVKILVTWVFTVASLSVSVAASSVDPRLEPGQYDVAAQTGIPRAFLNVYRPAELVLLALAGLVIAVAGALAPAGWAAKTRTAFALRAE
jgi:putative ABC transport system permease protein